VVAEDAGDQLGAGARPDAEPALELSAEDGFPDPVRGEELRVVPVEGGLGPPVDLLPVKCGRKREGSGQADIQDA